MEETECSKTTVHKIQTPGFTPVLPPPKKRIEQIFYLPVPCVYILLVYCGVDAYVWAISELRKSPLLWSLKQILS